MFAPALPVHRGLRNPNGDSGACQPDGIGRGFERQTGSFHVAGKFRKIPDPVGSHPMRNMRTESSLVAGIRVSPLCHLSMPSDEHPGCRASPVLSGGPMVMQWMTCGAMIG